MANRLDRWADPPLLVLASLADEPKHGYAIIRDVSETMGVRLTAGTLYAVIARLEAVGLIEPLASADRRRPYQITAAGRAALAEQSARMGQVASLAQARLGDGYGWAWRVSRPVPAEPGPLASLALMLYPPAWRERYGDEVRALLEEAGSGPATVASLAVRAVPAWVNPPRHLHDRESRMRASVGTVLVAWSVLTGVGAVFVQLTQLQGFRAPGHPLVQWCYLIFDAALAASVLTAAAGGVPLWLQMVRLARGQRRRRELAWLWMAVLVPAGYLALALTALTVIHDPEASGSWWFAGFAILGFGAAGLASAGPAVALKRLAPGGPAVAVAAAAAGLAAATVALAGLASAIAAAGLCLWTTSFAGYHHADLAWVYLLIVVAIAATATISAGRGIRATFAIPAR